MSDIQWDVTVYSKKQGIVSHNKKINEKKQTWIINTIKVVGKGTKVLL